MQGQRLGKFRIEKNVGDGEREVQTEGELSESLRGLKVSLNWFGLGRVSSRVPPFFPLREPIADESWISFLLSFLSTARRKSL